MSLLDPPPAHYPSGGRATAVSRPVIVDIRDHGTPGVSIGSDTALLNAALAAAGAGGTVLIPDGITLHTTNIGLNGRRISGGTIVGAGITSLIGMSGSGPELHRVRLYNDGGSQVISVAGGTSNLAVLGCDVGGAVSAASIGIQLNATGISGVRVERCRFDLCGYGILTNSSATDLDDVGIVGNRFTSISADAIELNHPGTAYVGASRVTISGNHISVTLGSGSTTGFGIGIAGATNVAIIGNQFDACRLQAVHIEDEAAHITIVGNVFDGSPIGVYALDGDHLVIDANAFNEPADTAIKFAYDVSTNPASYVITANVIRNAGVTGIAITADATQNSRISGNIITGSASHGIAHTATSTSVGDGQISITDNVATGNGGYGIYTAHHSSKRIAGNITGGNTLGGYGRPTTTANLRVPISDLTGEADAVISSSYSAWSPLLVLGDRAHGTLVVTAVRITASTNRAQGIFDIGWDGTTLTATPVGGQVANGVAAGIELREAAGNLEVRAFCSSSEGQTMRLWAQLHGIVLL